MNEELQKQLAVLLGSLMENASNATAWAKGEIPLLVQEKIALGRIEETAQEVVCLLFGLIFIAVAVKFWKASWQIMVEEEVPLIVLNLLGIGLGVILTYPSHAFFTVWFAPRIYIIEWLKSSVG